MPLWTFLFQVLTSLRSAFPREASFHWFCLVVISFITRTDDRGGVTKFIRAFSLGNRSYEALIKHFLRLPVDLRKLRTLWVNYVMRSQHHRLYRVNGKVVYVGDSTKKAKTGRRMPAVKRLKGSNNQFIEGHHLHLLSVLVCGEDEKPRFGIPLTASVCEGIKRSPNDTIKVLDRMQQIEAEIPLEKDAYLVYDRFHGSGKFMREHLACGRDVIVRLKHNAVGIDADGVRQPLATMGGAQWTWMKNPWGGADIHVATFTAEWPPLRRKVVVVRCHHPGKAPMLVISTDLTLSPEQVLDLYMQRWKIEVMLKASSGDVRAFGYQFWTKSKPKRERRTKNTYLHRCTEKERATILKKIQSYEYYVTAGLIAQGALQMLSLELGKVVLAMNSRFFLRTRTEAAPSEFVTREVLKRSVEKIMKAGFPYVAFADWLTKRNVRDYHDEYKQAA